MPQADLCSLSRRFHPDYPLLPEVHWHQLLQNFHLHQLLLKPRNFQLILLTLLLRQVQSLLCCLFRHWRLMTRSDPLLRLPRNHQSVQYYLFDLCYLLLLLLQYFQLDRLLLVAQRPQKPPRGQKNLLDPVVRMLQLLLQIQCLQLDQLDQPDLLVQLHQKVQKLLCYLGALLPLCFQAYL